MLNKKKYQLILFDFDGTLVDTAPDIALYANRVLEEYGYSKKSLEEVKGGVGRGVHELMKDLAPPFGEKPQELDEAVARFKKYYWDRPVVQTRPFRGVREVLAGDLAPVKKAIVTNKPESLALKILEELSMVHFFDKVIGLDAGYPPKPDPTSVREILKELNVEAAQTVLIGDSKIDAETCQNSGIDFVWVDYGYDTIDGYQPVETFSSPQSWGKLAV